MPWLYQLSYRKYFVDELYHYVIVIPLGWLGFIKAAAAAALAKAKAAKEAKEAAEQGAEASESGGDADAKAKAAAAAKAKAAAAAAAKAKAAQTGEATAEEEAPKAPSKNQPYLDKYSKHPMLQSRPVKKTGYIVITSDRGLAGGYNANMLRAVITTIGEKHKSKDEYGIFVIGRKGRDFFNKRNYPIMEEVTGLPASPDCAHCC